MKTLLIFNFILIAMIAFGLWCVKKYVKSERAQSVLFIVSSLLTVLCHYSSLLYHHFWGGGAMAHLSDTPNLILPIYPCNVVMWSCVVYAFLKNKGSRLGCFLCDYIFWFGIVSTLVGLFANVDFIRKPTLADYDVTKGIVAHATLLFNVLLLPVFRHVKVDVKRNVKHIVISVIEMLLIGLYCNLVFRVLVSKEAAYHVNSMFLIHSPFAGVEFLTYPIIAAAAILIYFVLFVICDRFAHKKGERFCDRCLQRIKDIREKR